MKDLMLDILNEHIHSSLELDSNEDAFLDQITHAFVCHLKTEHFIIPNDVLDEVQRELREEFQRMYRIRTYGTR